MPLHPQAEKFLAELAAQQPPSWEQMSPQEGRDVFASLKFLFGDPPSIDRVDDQIWEGEIPVRIYAPQANTAIPVVMYFHGGGWVLGDLTTHDTLCRRLARESGCAIVAVDYRRPPEDPYPAAVEDCYRATQYAAVHAKELGFDGNRLAVAGDSAGGNLAAAVAIRAREEARPTIHSQWLIYPVIEPRFDTPSYTEFAEGYGLTRRAMFWFWEQYLGPQVQEPPVYAAPIRADRLSGLPPAHIVTAEFDVLRDEGESFAEKLRGAGVPVSLRRYNGMIHGFIHFSAIFDDGMQAISDLGALMRERLRR